MNSSMAKVVTPIEISPKEIFSSIQDPVDLEIVKGILNVFLENQFTYKIRTEYVPSSWIEKPGYRIFCYIKKSKEAIIINTKGWHYTSVCLQMRILNNETLYKLDEYTEALRNTILNARVCINCGGVGCSRLSYIFTYKGIDYNKCHMLCNVFTFNNLTSQDIPSVMDIINREIEYGKPKRRK